MPPIHAAKLDKTRPVLILSRALVRPHLTQITVAPITTRSCGLSTEVHVGTANGLERNSVINCDNIVTVPMNVIGRLLGFLLPEQEPQLTGAILSAFDLEQGH